MSVRDHAEYEEAIGAYLLDALPELEAEVFERHMLRCDACREQVERLQPSVDALPRAVPQVPAPPGLKAQLMRRVRDELAEDAAVRRRSARPGWRPSLAWSAVLACAAVVGFAAYGVFELAQGPSRKTVTAMVDTHRLPGTARARLEVLENGKAAILRVSGLPSPGPGRVYQVWVRHGMRIEPGPTFTVDRRGGGAAAVPQGTRGANAVMVTRERAGGATHPGEIPVIVANV